MNLVKAFKRLWIFKPNPEKFSQGKFATNQEEAGKELHLSVARLERTGTPEPSTTKTVTAQGRVLKRETRRSPLLQTIFYKVEDGKYVTDRRGEFVLEEDPIPSNAPFLTDNIRIDSNTTS